MKQKLFPFTCEQCGNRFYVKASTVALGGTRHCSRACRFGMSPEDRFWRYVDKESDAPCWRWTAHLNIKSGYGEFRATKNSGIIPAHRFAWEMVHGPIPEGLFVCHNCPGGQDHRWCVYHKHLWLGTNRDNIQDALTKGTFARGEKAPGARLTEHQVREIRSLAGTMQQKEIAERYNVDKVTIWHIIHRTSWKHIP